MRSSGVGWMVDGITLFLLAANNKGGHGDGNETRTNAGGVCVPQCGCCWHSLVAMERAGRGWLALDRRTGGAGLGDDGIPKCGSSWASQDRGIRAARGPVQSKKKTKVGDFSGGQCRYRRRTPNHLAICGARVVRGGVVCVSM